jgi:hypothetical protein
MIAILLKAIHSKRMLHLLASLFKLACSQWLEKLIKIVPQGTNRL